MKLFTKHDIGYLTFGQGYKKKQFQILKNKCFISGKKYCISAQNKLCINKHSVKNSITSS